MATMQEQGLDEGPRILDLEAVEGGEAGGKALGLARLARLGVRVPAGFVLVGARSGELPEGLEAAYDRLGGGKVAVRSSARGEDGAETSYAGQYETVLGVEGHEALRVAVARCLASSRGERARAYAAHRAAEGANGHMAVVVQRMVEARAAGVLFTVDPVTSSRERIVVDAVRGLGEGLVAGTATPDQFLLDRRGALLGSTAAGVDPALTEDELRELVGDALRAEAAFGTPLDMEWALDGEGRLHWLQARPVTTLEDRLAELGEPPLPTDVLTKANIGEMMPGAVCPLTVTTTFWAVEQGLQEMQVRFGGLDRRRPDFVMTTVHHGHLFFNLSALADCGRHVAGQSAASLALAICGRHVPELRQGPKDGPVRLAWNAVRYLRYVLSAPAEIERFAPLVRAFRIDAGPTALESWRSIDRARRFLFETVHMHLHSSSGSGSLIGVIQGILTRGAAPTPEDEGALVAMLAGATSVESAELVEDLDRILDAIAAAPGGAEAFRAKVPAEAVAWLRGASSGAAGTAFARFLSRHGHRAMREADMRQPSWADDPAALVVSMQAALAGARRVAGGSRPEPGVRFEGRVPEALLRYARATVRNRERSKSMMVAVLDRFKKAYRGLSGQLVEEGLLPDRDAIHFLTHGELGRLAAGREPELGSLALRRRRAHDRHGTLCFEDLSVGLPEPIDPTEAAPTRDGVLQGRPASHGVVEGRARVVRTAAEAAALEPGEILVAPVTDVGWSPYFGLIGGLATDVGSPISHGAVVAREYGLPAVVNLRVATRTVHTGDRVVLDGGRGTLRVLEPG